MKEGEDNENADKLEDRRSLRLSSIPKENNVKSLERILFNNQYMHQSYKP